MIHLLQNIVIFGVGMIVGIIGLVVICTLIVGSKADEEKYSD